MVPRLTLDGPEHRAERDRVFEALFEVPAEVQKLGRYLILGTLGKGGMGVVLEAFDPTLDRRIALKVLHHHLDDRHTTRLLREAMAMAKLSHPNVVHVYESGQADGHAYIAMELVRGRSLHDWGRQTPRPDWRACVRAYVQAGEGLAAAHAVGLVHRDFKPSNAVIDGDGRVRVLDFGLAREASDHDSTADLSLDSAPESIALGSSLTVTGTVLGTPAYMPPEQMRGGEADARSDQFAFCVSLFEALYGERPFEGDSMIARLMSMQDGSIRPAPPGATVPSGVRAVVIRGLAAEPAQRWPSMEVLLSELRRLADPSGRRWGSVGLIAGVAVLGSGLVAGRYLQVEERCTGAAAQLEGVWDETQRRSVEAAMLATEVPYASDTWERLEPRLDAYADAWVDGHVEACAATSIRHEQSEAILDLRMGCLRSSQVALRSAVRVLSDADAEAVSNAITLVADLPEVARCADVERLARQAQRVPPPEDVDVARSVESMRDQLAEIAAMQKAGRYVSALAQVEPVVEQAESLGYGPLHAEAEFRRGFLLQETGRYLDAERALEHAHELALRHAHDEVVLDATQSLIYVVGIDLARPSAGQQWAKTAVPMAQSTGRDPEVANSLDNLALVLVEQGEYAKARDLHEQALSLLLRSLGTDHPSVARYQYNLGHSYVRLGEHEAAKRFHDRALRTWETALGPTHPDVALGLGGLAIVHDALGEHDEARRKLEQALAIERDALGATHPQVAATLTALGSVLQRQGDPQGAERHHRRANQILDDALGPGHPKVATSARSLGIALEHQGRYDEAEDHFRRALGIQEQVLSEDHPQRSSTEYDLGRVLYYQGKYAEAEPHYARAQQILERAPTKDHLQLVRIASALGSVIYGQGRYEEAELQYRRALRMLEQAPSPDRALAASTHSNLGDALRRQGAHDEASDHYAQALRAWESVLGPEHPDLAFPLVGLALVGLAQRDLEAARPWAERAVSLRAEGRAPPSLRADAQFVLARILGSTTAQRAQARALAEQARDAYAEHGPGEESNLVEVEGWLSEHARRRR